PTPTPTDAAPTNTARFTVIEGTVKVKPAGTLEWLSADKTMNLKRNDLVRTGPASAAEVTFFDGTVLHVRPDSLITIEESTEDPSSKKRKVSMHISSGEVNFSTSRENAPGSATEISAGGDARTPTLKTTALPDTEGGLAVT